MDKIIMKTKGNNSPNELNVFVDQGKNVEQELKTIMDLICLISKEASKLEDKENENIVDPEKKIYKRFAEYQDKLISEITDLRIMYGGKIETAREQLGLTDGISDKVAQYLRYYSDRYLSEVDGNPLLALDKLTDFFRSEMRKMNEKYSYDLNSIRYYLLEELIKCNIFPNPEEKKI